LWSLGIFFVVPRKIWQPWSDVRFFVCKITYDKKSAERSIIAERFFPFIKNSQLAENKTTQTSKTFQDVYVSGIFSLYIVVPISKFVIVWPVFIFYPSGEVGLQWRSWPTGIKLTPWRKALCSPSVFTKG
jgi:hypothetical protein